MRFASLAVSFATIALVTGCADMSYRQLRLGQEPGEYDRTLPNENTRRTDRGICHVTADRGGRTDAIVVMLATDRRICAKLRATRIDRDLGWKKETGYLLEGEIDPKLANLGSVGPFDAIRAIIADLDADASELFVQETHGWVVAGLYRLMQRWPHVAESATPPAALNSTLERVPAGGTASLSIDERGVLRLEYRTGSTPAP